jgi:hypothetical protein
MPQFANEKLNNLYLALVALYGEDRVGWQDAGWEENEKISIDITLKSDVGEETIEINTYIDSKGFMSYGSLLMPEEINLEIPENWTGWLFEK